MTGLTRTILDLFFHSFILKPTVHSKTIEYFLQQYKNKQSHNSLTIGFFHYLNQTKPIKVEKYNYNEKDNFFDWLSDSKNLKEKVKDLRRLKRKK